VVASEQVGQDEPGGGGAPADGAVRDQLLAARTDVDLDHPHLRVQEVVVQPLRIH
jgi:hypothetical protein